MLKNRTLKSLLAEPIIAKIAPDAIRNWDLTKEEFYNYTLQEMEDKMGWANPGRGLERLLELAGRGEYYYSLYSEEECNASPEKKGTNVVYFPSDDASADEKPYIFLVPGGGFVNVWNLTEGWPIARIFNEMGYHVLILTYQVAIDGAAVHALDDFAKAMEIIHARKDEFHVDPDKYITCGFSAGGYLVCLWNTEKGYKAYNIAKPQACFPIYPVTSYKIIDEEGWDGSEDRDEFAMSSVGCTMEEAVNSCFEIPEHVEGFPPTAIFLAAQDELVDPEHSKKLAKGLDEAGIPNSLEIGPTGGHGFADGIGMCMEGWPERAIEWFKQL